MNTTHCAAGIVQLLPYLISALLSAAMAIVATRNRGDTTVTRFGLVLWSEFAWTAMLISELLARELESKIFWDGAQFPATLAAVTSLFSFALNLSGKDSGSASKCAHWLYLPVAISAVVALMPAAAGLLRTNPAVDWSVPLGELVYGYTMTDYVLFAFEYGLSIAAVVLLVHARSANSGHKHLGLMIAGFVVPLVLIFPSVLGVRLFSRRDLSPIWFMLGNIPIALGLIRFRLFDIAPLARRTVVDSLGDPVVVLDGDLMVLDCNRAFAELLKIPARRLRGFGLPEIMRAVSPETGEAVLQAIIAARGSSIQNRVAFSAAHGTRLFMIGASAVPDSGRNPGTTLFTTAVFRDVTELAAVEQQLQAWNMELEARIRSRVHDLEQEIARRKSAEHELHVANRRIVKSQHEILLTLSELVENRSPETANHVLRVGEYARILAEASGLSKDSVELIAEAAPLHDVGKIAIPDHILNKPGRLTIDEMCIMKTHSIVGYRILGSSERSIIRVAAVIALEHHEQWSGHGYPAGKLKEKISLPGRIVCICDVFDALATVRPYKDAWEIDRIVDFIHDESGHMFDPALVELLMINQHRFRKVALCYPDTKHSASTPVA
ncbi:MAG TPA: HD domain-containing phosphohydrolase [bacterium]|nr:HD domain-containing phosphohydrolase [bacterium]